MPVSKYGQEKVVGAAVLPASVQVFLDEGQYTLFECLMGHLQ